MKLQLIAVFLLINILLAPISRASNFLVISDIHLNTSAAPFSMVINPLPSDSNANDLDTQTFQTLITAIKQNIDKHIVPTPDFIIVLGDLVGHTSSHPAGAISAEKSVFSFLKSTLPYPIFYTAGNNDSLVGDYGPFASNSGSPYTIAMQSSWGNGFLSTGVTCSTPATHFPCLISQSGSQNSTEGYYSAYIQSGFRLINLNTVLFSRVNFTAEANTELTWLSTQLQQAQQNKEAVLIAMHIPPGRNIFDDQPFWTQEQSSFLELMKTYRTIIVGILASHTHEEEVKIIEGIGVNVYFTAALSTSHKNAPSAKTFYYDNNHGNWQLSNTLTYHFTGTARNPIFNTLYSYESYYCTGTDISLSACLTDKTVTPATMKRYFSAGNPNFGGDYAHSNDIYINF